MFHHPPGILKISPLLGVKDLPQKNVLFRGGGFPRSYQVQFDFRFFISGWLNHQLAQSSKLAWKPENGPLPPKKKKILVIIKGCDLKNDALESEFN